MVEWRPVFGILPPFSEFQWQEIFTKYQQTPEFQYINHQFELEDFKGIFWLEYWHRILGRLIGLAFGLPLLYFWWQKKIPSYLKPRLIALFILGGLQGLLGWYMVKSGLVDNPHVSQYRLTAHLMLAVAVYLYMLWIALNLLRPIPEQTTHPQLYKASTAVLILAVLTMASGGLVAGLKAGFNYNTFPLIAGQWIPDGLFSMQPWYSNFFENVMTVQFTHRWLALTTFCAILLLWLYAGWVGLFSSQCLGFHILLILALLQMSLGISVLLLQVPVVLASLHQAGALSVLTVLLYLIHQQRTTAIQQQVIGQVDKS